MQQQCRKCGATANMKCGRCTLTAYCSRDCQSSDWSNHRGECITPAAYRALVESTVDNLHQKIMGNLLVMIAARPDADTIEARMENNLLFNGAATKPGVELGKGLNFIDIIPTSRLEGAAPSTTVEIVYTFGVIHRSRYIERVNTILPKKYEKVPRDIWTILLE